MIELDLESGVEKLLKLIGKMGTDTQVSELAHILDSDGDMLAAYYNAVTWELSDWQEKEPAVGIMESGYTQIWPVDTAAQAWAKRIFMKLRDHSVDKLFDWKAEERDP